MKSAVFHDHAKAELDEAVTWYERHRRGLGEEFLSAVEGAVQRVCKNPHVGSLYRATRYRYVLVRRFPYVVFYFDGPDMIQVMAVAHGHRRPGYWTMRSI